MSRFSRRFLLVASMAFTLVAALSLGACSKHGAKETLPETGVSDESQPAVEPGISEDQQQKNARDVYRPAADLEDVHFDFDKSDIRADARDILQKNADWINANPDARVQIEGHCDERGTEEYNLALGERRANAVKNYLVSLGVGADRLYTISYGEELPVDPGHTEEAWDKNRRGHFLVTK